MPNFSARGIGSGASGFNNTDPTSANNAVLLPLGWVVETRHGRAYRWCKVSSTADLVAGNWIQSSAIVPNHVGSGVSTNAAAIGDTKLTVTPGNTGGAANLYAEGYVVVDTSTGLGYTYGITGHAAITASTAFTLNLSPDDPIQVAFGASTKLNLYANPYQNVIQGPATTKTGTCVGVATYIITASQNGWLQTWGPCGVLQSDTTAVGLSMGVPSGTAGATVAFAAATTTYLGEAMQTNVSGHINAVFLRIG